MVVIVGDKGDTYYIVLRGTAIVILNFSLILKIFVFFYLGSAVLLLPKSLEDAEILERQAEKRQEE